MTLEELKELKKNPTFPACETVGELIEVLQGLPSDLPIDPYNHGVKPVVYNRKHHDMHLSLEENDGTWDDED